jgi:hypothetical protein
MHVRLVVFGVASPNNLGNGYQEMPDFWFENETDGRGNKRWRFSKTDCSTTEADVLSYCRHWTIRGYHSYGTFNFGSGMYAVFFFHRVVEKEPVFPGGFNGMKIMSAPGTHSFFSFITVMFTVEILGLPYPP